MIVQAAIAAELPGLRAEAESRMTSRATIRRRVSRTSQDESTGVEASQHDVTHADIPCRVSGSGTSSASRTISYPDGTEVEVPVRTLSLPALTQDIADGDFVEITSGDLSGAVFRVVESEGKDQATALRVSVVGDVAPEEW